MYDKDSSISDRFSRLKREYAQTGTRRSVELRVKNSKILFLEVVTSLILTVTIEGCSGCTRTRFATSSTSSTWLKFFQIAWGRTSPT